MRKEVAVRSRAGVGSAGLRLATEQLVRGRGISWKLCGGGGWLGMGLGGVGWYRRRAAF